MTQVVMLPLLMDDEQVEESVSSLVDYIEEYMPQVEIMSLEEFSELETEALDPIHTGALH